jgi:hypothetical protein
MYYILISAAAIFFIAHVALLFTAFPNAKLAKGRYFYSHLTLWITGAIVFAMAMLFNGTGESGFFDYFNTTYKRVMIIVFTLALSLTAHCLVRFVALPLMAKRA